MLRKETVDSATLELLNRLMNDPELKDFFLVGGTALALQIGHRISIDIDLFSEQSFNQAGLLDYLESELDFKTDFIANNTLKGYVGNVKVDFLTHAYKLTEDLITAEGIRLASLGDIAAMKLNAIAGNGTRLKDFIDIAFLSNYLSFSEMVDSYEQKYKSRNPVMLIKSLLYHNDIDFNEPILMTGNPYSWKKIEDRLNEMEKHPLKIFSTLPVN